MSGLGRGGKGRSWRLLRESLEGEGEELMVLSRYAAVLAPFSSSSFLPSIPAIVEELDTTATILNITVAIFIVVIGITPLVWSNYAGVCMSSHKLRKPLPNHSTDGRKPIYLISLPIFTLGSLGVALSPSLTALIITRIIQGPSPSPTSDCSLTTRRRRWILGRPLRRSRNDRRPLSARETRESNGVVLLWSSYWASRRASRRGFVRSSRPKKGR